MNWKNFVNQIKKETNSLAFIGMSKFNHGSTFLRYMTFFFMGSHERLQELVNKYDSIGLGVVVEKSRFWEEYEISIAKINREQQYDERIFRIKCSRLNEGYIQILSKLKKLI